VVGQPAEREETHDENIAAQRQANTNMDVIFFILRD
jgi:hypothetical protein